MMNLYGSPVSQNIVGTEIKSIQLLNDSFYVLSNGQITEASFLKSIEIYSFAEFKINFHVNKKIKHKLKNLIFII